MSHTEMQRGERDGDRIESDRLRAVGAVLTVFFVHCQKGLQVEMEHVGIDLQVAFPIHARDALEATFLHGAEVPGADAGLLGNVADLKAVRQPLFPQNPADVLHVRPPVAFPGDAWQCMDRGFLFAGVMRAVA